MKEYLPGNLQERLRKLREANGYGTRQELADKLGIDKSTYGRMESGATKTVSSDILIKLSELYKVVIMETRPSVINRFVLQNGLKCSKKDYISKDYGKSISDPV